eukprot:22196-Alexandrium_andersonii.AAC.1
MSASLVGSEMCIRDSSGTHSQAIGRREEPRNGMPTLIRSTRSQDSPNACLLYTSDAADDM